MGRHDHRKCVSCALGAAERVCDRRGVKLTPLRRRILELVWRGHAPVGAYEILERLGSADGRRAAPPTVYRGLEFLIAQGLVHRIESLNAFVGCAHPESPHEAQYLICEACGDAVEIEIDGLIGQIGKAAAAQGFEVGGQTIEVRGHCQGCRAP
jgi:Fur family zinc uptake transcriptional regulator